MKPAFSLSVPNPCSENWNSFTPTATGGFCSRCQKNVIDFTNATDDEIISFISKKPEHACGRFRSNQLKTYPLLPDPNVTPGFMLLKAGITSLLLLLVSKPSFAQGTPLIKSTEINTQIKITDSTPRADEEVLIRGRVLSAEDSEAVPGVSVAQRGTTKSTTTDRNGAFTLRINLQEGHVIVLSFIGLQTLEYSITDHTAALQIMMKEDSTALGEVFVIAGELTIRHDDLALIDEHKKSRFKRFWEKFMGKRR